MKCWGLVIFVLAGLASAQSVLDVFAGLPACGQKCVLTELVTYDCNLTSLYTVSECLCPNHNALRNISTCLQASCTLEEMYTVSSANEELCARFPVPNRGSELVIGVAVMASLTIPLILIRIFTRLWISNQLGWDDYAILVCLPAAIAAVPVLVLLAQKGFGRHVWNINLMNVPTILKLFFGMQLLYIYVQVLAKMSILCFYLRVFTQKWFRYTAYGGLVWLAVHGFIFIFLDVFQCLPLSSLWDPTKPSHCLNKSALVYAGAATSILEDVVILVMPIPCISSLHLARSKKWGVGLMFAVGSFSLVTSCIRVKFLTGYGSMADATWDNLDTIFWSEIEVYSALLCACIPSLRQFMTRVFPASTVQDSYISSNANSTFSPHGMSVSRGGDASRASHARNLSEDDDDVDDLAKPSNVPSVLSESDGSVEGDRLSNMNSFKMSDLSSDIIKLKYTNDENV